MSTKKSFKNKTVKRRVFFSEPWWFLKEVNITRIKSFYFLKKETKKSNNTYIWRIDIHNIFPKLLHKMSSFHKSKWSVHYLKGD